MSAPAGGLATRALGAARRACDADREGFARRHQDWHIWQARAREARTLAAALGIAVEQVTVTDDPDRTYGPVPGDLLTVTDPATTRTWRFLPDLTCPGTFLLLDECPDCAALVPITRIATLADLGAWLDVEDPDHDPAEGLPDTFDADPAHHPDCGFAE